jgi:SAM-dependent methyltransferase
MTIQASWLVRAHQLCVQRVYATHNQSRPIRKAIALCLRQLESGGRGLNVGAGMTRIHPRIINLDFAGTGQVDVRGDAQALPFAQGSFAVVVTQETLEHVRDPRSAVAEIHRVMCDGGWLYCQVPFVIGYHPGPHDFVRWSREGICELVERAGFECQEVGVSVGPATGFYRIAVEFWAVLFSVLWSGLYLPVKGLAALMLTPLKLLDELMIRSPQADRIAGGYYVIARKIQPDL